jgi:glycerol-3-phosphate acyltransferase PlsY
MAWIALAFASGSLPFAVWLGRWVAGRDVRGVGDGNPGAANAWQAGGWRLGVLVLLLDFIKGALPVAAAHYGARLAGLSLAAVAVAPVAGHAFSPWLLFRGGKALTVSFGVLAGLTLGHLPIVLGLFMIIFYATLRTNAWAVMFSLAGLLAHLLLSFPEPALVAAAAGIAAVLALKHAPALRQRPQLRPALARAFVQR